MAKNKRNKKFKRPRKKRAVMRTDQATYSLNPDFEFFNELKNLIMRSSPAEKDEMTKRISGLGRVKLAVVSGVFMNINNGGDVYEAPADLFIVGDDINRRKLNSFLVSVEADVGKEIKFSLMDKDEFQYRYGMFDRFIRVLFEGPHEKIINKLGL